MITVDIEGPPEPNSGYMRRVLRSFVEDKQYQRALDFCDLMAVHPHMPQWRQEWANGFGDAMHLLLLAETMASFRSAVH